MSNVVCLQVTVSDCLLQVHNELKSLHQNVHHCAHHLIPLVTQENYLNEGSRGLLQSGSSYLSHKRQ